MKRFIKILASVSVCILLSLGIFCGCSNNNSSVNANFPQQEATKIGSGTNEMFFFTENLEGEKSYYDIFTDENTVGDALVKVGLIKGEQGAYGLYVKEVNGIILDYNTDGKYWAFYINGNYANAGVDTVQINPGDIYMFIPE